MPHVLQPTEKIKHAVERQLRAAQRAADAYATEWVIAEYGAKWAADFGEPDENAFRAQSDFDFIDVMSGELSHNPHCSFCHLRKLKRAHGRITLKEFPMTKPLTDDKKLAELFADFPADDLPDIDERLVSQVGVRDAPPTEPFKPDPMQDAFIKGNRATRINAAVDKAAKQEATPADKLDLRGRRDPFLLWSPAEFKNMPLRKWTVGAKDKPLLMDWGYGPPSVSLSRRKPTTHLSKPLASRTVSTSLGIQPSKAMLPTCSPKAV